MRAHTTIALVTGALTFMAHGYDLGTHASMTQHAFENSKLADEGQGTLADALGLTRWMTLNPKAPFRTFGTRSIGIHGFIETPTQTTAGAIRKARSYELNAMPTEIADRDAFRINGWLMRGAVREDDGAGLIALRKNEPFGDNPYGAMNRFCNHFYDPLLTHGAAGRGFDGCFAAPASEPEVNDALQWGLGSLNPLASPPNEWFPRRNHFTLADGRESMWRALTLKTGSGVAIPNIAPRTSEDMRKLYWAATFRTLGNVLHSLQDMAQPQHTRNEGHGAGPSTIYEGYIDARATGADSYFIDGQNLTAQRDQLPDLTYDGYAVPRFNRISDYWSTRTPSQSARLVGLADYSNRGFYTSENNVDDRLYPLPLINPGPSNTVRTTLPSYSGVQINYIIGTVPDDLAGPSDPIAMSSQGVLQGTVRNYNLTKQNHDDRAGLLIKRAVAYSTGTLDYFFRGKLEITLPNEGVYSVADHSTNKVIDTQGFSSVRLKVKNITESIVPPVGEAVPQSMTGGVLVAVVRFHRNICYLPDLSGEYGAAEIIASKGANVFKDPASGGCRRDEEEIVVSDAQPIALSANGAPQQVTFVFPNVIPINGTDIYLQVVYRGILGEEQDAVVVATKDISEPTFVSFVNATSYYTSQGTAGRSPRTLSFGFSEAFPTLINTVSLEPNQFSRVAVLAERVNLIIRCPDCINAMLPWPDVTNQSYGPGANIASPYQRVHGVYLGNNGMFLMVPVLDSAMINQITEPFDTVPTAVLPFTF